MGVKLHKLDASPPARAAMMACGIVGVPTEMIDVNLLAGEHLKPEYIKKNPLHTVPVLEDGELILHDSHAILMYLIDTYGQESFYPKDVKQRALVNHKLFFNSAILFSRLRNVTYPLVVQGVESLPQKLFDDIEEAYGFMEEFLSRTKFLAGDHITIADVAAIANMTTLDGLVTLNKQKYPKTAAWIVTMTSQSYCQKYNESGAAYLNELVKLKLQKLNVY